MVISDNNVHIIWSIYIHSYEILMPVRQRELNEFSDTKECAKTEFQCINGEKCIDKQNVCNGYFDCQGKFILEINFRNLKFENSTKNSTENSTKKWSLSIEIENFIA